MVRVIFKLVSSELSSLLSIGWVGLIQSVEGLNNRKRLASRGKKEFSSRLPLDFIYIISSSDSRLCTFSSPGPSACQPTLQILDLSISTVSQFFVINLFLYRASLVAQNGKGSTCNARDLGLGICAHTSCCF